MQKNAPPLFKWYPVLNFLLKQIILAVSGIFSEKIRAVSRAYPLPQRGTKILPQMLRTTTPKDTTPKDTTP